MQTPPTPIGLAQELVKVFVVHPHLQRRQVHFRTEAGGRVILKGSVRSFFEKQMAQEAARKVPGVASIDNQLSVESN